MPKKEKVKGSDNEASLTTNRSNFLQSKQKKKDSVENQDNQNYESNINDDSNERITTKDLTETFEADVQVGAFAVAGIEEGRNDFDETELPDSRVSMAQTSQDVSSLKITSARVVDDVIFDATPLEDNTTPAEGAPNRVSIRRYTLIAIVLLSLLMAIIIPTIILTRQSPQVSPNDSRNVDSAKDKFLNELKPLLTNASIQELERPDSIQSTALAWLSNNSNFSAYSFHRKVQRYAMAVLFYFTLGTSWKNNTGWLIDADECTWYQSSYENVCVNKALQVLSLRDNALKGLLPDDFTLLSSLTYLDLSSNALAGSIPSEIGALTKLTSLVLSHNSLDGAIPSEIGALTKLTSLVLSYNSLDGAIPSEIGALTTLEWLDLSSNSLTGSIPSEIGALTTLTVLTLSSNSFVGSIPSEIGALTKLTYLVLSDNSLAGSIPSEIGALTKLTSLYLSINALAGAIPSEIGALTTLTYLYLSSNSLDGFIPSEIGALTKLEVLYLSDNSLDGAIPESLCKQGLLIYADVDENVTCSCCN